MKGGGGYGNVCRYGVKFWGLWVSFFYKLESRKQKLSQIYLKHTTDKRFVLRQTIVFM